MSPHGEQDSHPVHLVNLPYEGNNHICYWPCCIEEEEGTTEKKEKLAQAVPIHLPFPLIQYNVERQLHNQGGELK